MNLQVSSRSAVGANPLGVLYLCIIQTPIETKATNIPANTAKAITICMWTGVVEEVSGGEYLAVISSLSSPMRISSL